jgi:hypothetical protein
VELLRGLWDSGQAPWRVWDGRAGGEGQNLGRRAADWAVSPEAALRSRAA